MRWKKRDNANLFIAGLLSIAYVVVTFLLMIGPMHVNSTGAINEMTAQSFYALIFLFFALSLNWFAYTVLRKKPEILFFALIIMFIVFIFADVMMFTT